MCVTLRHCGVAVAKYFLHIIKTPAAVYQERLSRVNYFVRFGDNYDGRLNGSKILRFLLVFFPVANAIDFNNRGVMDNSVDGSYRH